MSTSILSGKYYLLHLSDKSKEDQAVAEIRNLGAEISQFLTNEVNVVITDHPSVNKFLNCGGKQSFGRSPSVDGIEDGQWSALSGLASVSSDTTVGKDDNSRCSNTEESSIDVEGPPVTRQRAKIGRRQPCEQDSKGDSKTKVPFILTEAQRMGLKIVRYREFVRQLVTQKRKRKLVLQSLAPTKKSLLVGAKKQQIIRLRDPFVKVEDRSKQYRPVFEVLDSWPKINVNTGGKGCVFAGDQNADRPRASICSSSPGGGDMPKKKRKAARKLRFDQPQLDRRNIDSMGVTLQTDSKDPGEYQRARPGVCDLCDVRTDNIEQHLTSDTHKKNLNSNVYERLDDEIAKGPTLEQFLAFTLRHVCPDNKGTATPFCSPKQSPRRVTERRQGISSPSFSLASPSRIHSSVLPFSSKSPKKTPYLGSPLRSPRRGAQLQLVLKESASPVFTFKVAPNSLRNGQVLVKTNIAELK